MRAWPSVLCLAALACGCASSPRFRDAPPIWRVDDDQNIPEPSEREYDAKEYFANIFVIKRLDRTLQIKDREPAHNVNALEEVPDSAWFQNRLGIRQVPPAEAAKGADTGGPPKPPLSVIGGKLGGGNPGFIIKDQTGRKFLVKFDTEQNPELQTSAGVIVNRVFWTAGYNVPSDHVFWFRREELGIDPGAKYTNPQHDKVPFDASKIDEVLLTAPQPKDGRYRGFASQLLEGKPKGGFSPDGQRKDDDNDRVRHEHRRELRGLRVLAAWVNHSDMKEDNTLDMYVEGNGRRYLKHYFLDFGEALDGHGAEKSRREDGWENFIDWEMQAKAMFAFGLWKRPWEDVKVTPWPSIGSFTAEPFDPLAWREAYPYWPFVEADDADNYWGAKLVMRFDRPMIEAIVAEGKLSDADAARYLVETLVKRRDALGRAYFELVSPLDDFALTPEQLCMTDLSVRYGFVPGGVVEWLNGSKVVFSRSVSADGRVCVKAPQSDAYTVFRMRVRRGKEEHPPLELHFKAGPKARILGLVRLAR
ncbi:MAG: hypothetical protein EOO73_18335 [Myxococcales bacterium]|nr:MAG: hypothetical protein EOO73_18335 [Myxococcales bacterium]